MNAAPSRADRAHVGDRLPDVILRPDHGVSLHLHADLAGRPRWLRVFHSHGGPGPLPALAGGDCGLCVGPVVAQVPAGWRAFAAHPAWCALFDPDVALRLDANLRVAAMVAPDAIAGLAEPVVAPLPPAQTAGCAPVLQIPDVLDDDLCDRLVAHLEHDCGGGEPSAVLVHEHGRTRAHVDPTIKQRRETPIRDVALESVVDAMLRRRVLPEIARVFQFTAARRDPFKLLAYPAGAGYFRAHRDNDAPDVAHRRFAISVNLNSGEYEGGDFRYPEFGPHQYAPGRGGALVFSCSLLHEVTPVSRGVRRALTTFVL